jgi:hypothetical protein
MRDAAAILEPVKDQLVVVGALAVQIALDGHEAALTPTRDIDAGLDASDADSVVAHLEGQGLRRSAVPHEREFTWVKDEIKVQLMAPFNPIAKSHPPGKGLPDNNIVGELQQHRWLVAFEQDPSLGRFYAARPVALVGLKEEAFGRTRPNGEKVDRDYSDVALLFDRLHDDVVAEAEQDGQMRIRARRAASRLTEGEPLEGAVRELVASGEQESVPVAEAMVKRAAGDLLAALE